MHKTIGIAIIATALITANGYADVQVIYPNGGETWVEGFQYTITWTGAVSSYYKLAIHTMGSIQIFCYTTTVWGPDGSHSWWVPNPWTYDEDLEWFVTIYRPFSGDSDDSDAHFHIIKQQHGDPP